MNLSAISIGTSSAPLKTVTSDLILFVNSADAYISNTGNLKITVNNPISANIVNISTKGSLSFSGSLQANDLTLNAIGNMNLGVAGEVPTSVIGGSNTLNLFTTGAINVFSTIGGGQVTMTGASVSLLNSQTLNATGNLSITNSAGNLLVDGLFNANSIVLSSNKALSLGAASDITQTIITSASTVDLTGLSTISNYSSISGIDFTVSTQAYSNLLAGQLTTTSSLSISGANGGLTLTGIPHSIALPAGGSLILSAKGPITAGSGAGSILSDVALGQLHSIQIDALGNFSSPFTGLQVVADGKGNGGLISISAANLVYNGKGSLSAAFNLNAAGSTNAGSEVDLKLSNSPGGIVIGNAVGNYNIDASGVNGARTEILTSGNLTVAMNFLKVNASGNGTGSIISLTAGKNLLITGNVDTHNGSGTYGDVTLQANGSKAFVVGGDGTTTNGIVGLTPNVGQGVTGDTVSVGNNTGITVNTGFEISSKTGDLTANTTILTNNGQVLTPATLHIINSGSIIYPSGTTGKLAVGMFGIDLSSTTGNVTLNTALPATSFLQLSAPKGLLTLPAGTTSLTALPVSGSGGTINITAKSINTLNLSLHAAASTNAGAGGTILFALTGTSALNVGPTLTFDVTKGSTSTTGGNLTVSNGGDLIVDAASLKIGPLAAGANGANLTLQAGAAGKGALIISNTALFAGGAVNNLVLRSNSTNSFALGGATAKTNGITESGITLSAETIAISNTGGGIINGTGGALTATAVGTANAIDLNAGGSIGLSHASPLLVSTSDLAVTSKGSAFISNSQAVSLDGVTVAKVFDYASASDITAAVKMTAPTLIINVNSITPGLSSNSSTAISVTAASGAVQISDAFSGTITLNALSSSGPVTLDAGGSITTLATSTVGGSAITLNAGGSAGKITIGANLTSSGAIALNAAGKGTIVESGKTTVIKAASLDMTTQGANIGGSHTAPLLVDATALSAATGKGGAVFIKNNAATTTLNGSA
ncbi:MAG: hypothetical protein JSS86_18175, partial [Cyanobacteria bacterium SZAS LIN-2]|nr:hypothetical protein [Cyanobacteria bacterium SZAS LIN-2]